MPSKHQDSEQTSENAGPWDGFLAVLGFMTRIPVPFRALGPAEAVWAFPLVGLIIGAIGGLVYWVAHELGLSNWVAAFLSVGATALTTGALHEDGLADTFDGLWGGATAERRIEIMRDSRIGGFGALALIIATGLKVTLIAEIETPLVAANAIISAHILARVVPAALMISLPPASTSGLAARSGRPGTGHVALAVILALGLAMIVIGPSAGIAALVLCAVGFGWHKILRTKLAGHNGDTLGAGEQLAEIACLMTFTIALGANR